MTQDAQPPEKILEDDKAGLRAPKRRPLFKANKAVFFPSAALIAFFVVLVILNHDSSQAFFAAAQDRIATDFGWFFTLTANLMLVFTIYLAFSRFGRIRLGGADAQPDFTWTAWFSMLFSAGMGIGLVFYAVAEPLLHFTAPPLPPGPGEPSYELAEEAMGFTFLHWGFHPWAIYSVLGLSLSYMTFNRNLPLSLRSVFAPLFPKSIHGLSGHVIDTLATLATLFGVATSLGLGVAQVNAGLNTLIGLPQTLTVQLILITVITLIATASVVSGVKAGIRRLSELNMIMAGLLMLFVILIGPTLFILNAFGQNIGYYLQHFVEMATWNETYTGEDWQNAWTIFYYAWWISWSPFVAMFIARISRGRTIREFIAGVLLVPTTIAFLWLTVFGDSALAIHLSGDTALGQLVQTNVAKAMYHFLDYFPFAGVSSALATIVVVLFFVTSSDSGSLVIDMITAGGDLNPPIGQRIFWALTEGVVAAALLIGGGLTALQTASIMTGLPFAVVLLLVAYAFHKALREEIPKTRKVY